MILSIVLDLFQMGKRQTVSQLSCVHTERQCYGFGIVKGIVTNCFFHTKRILVILTAVCLHALESPHGTVLL